MAERQPESPRGPFVCEDCGQEWPSPRALGGHMKAHIKGKAPGQAPSFPSVPAPAFGPGPRMRPPVMPPFVLPPPVMGLGQPVAPAGLFFRGGLPCLQVRQPLRDPVVYDAGGAIRMVLLEPNHAFWAPYRMGMDPPVEIDFMGLRPSSRPASPSPSFSKWLNSRPATASGFGLSSLLTHRPSKTELDLDCAVLEVVV